MASPGPGTIGPMQTTGQPRGHFIKKFPRHLTHLPRLRPVASTEQADRHSDEQGAQHHGNGIFPGTLASGAQGLLGAVPGQPDHAVRRLTRFEIFRGKVHGKKGFPQHRIRTCVWTYLIGKFPHPGPPSHTNPSRMALSYSLAPLPSLPPRIRKVLVTGAAGRIGSYYTGHAPGHHHRRLLVRTKDDRSHKLEAFGEIVTGTLDDCAALEKACAGIDTVLHLAGNPRPDAGWDELLEANIKGTRNVLAAAKTAGCRRVVLASSIHAVSGYSADVQVRTAEPVNPGDLYGVSKCFAEALGRYYAEKEGLSVIALRIGAFQSMETARKEDSLWMMDCFVSRRDLHSLIVKCIDDTRLRFAIFHGVSDNRFKRLDISDARELLGYQPQDDLTRENPALRPLHLGETVLAHNVTDPGQKSGLENS